MKPRWYWTRRQISAQAATWEQQKSDWLFHMLARLIHRAGEHGMERTKIINCLRTVAKALEGLG